MSGRETRNLGEWVRRWSRQPVEQGTPAEIVGPKLTFNQAQRTPWRDGDVDVLVVESQGVWLWGCDQQGQFFDRENEPGSPWLLTGENEEEFWLHQAAFEYLSSRFPAHRSVNGAPRSQAELVLAVTQPLPCGEWHWPGRTHQMRYKDDSLAMVCEDDDYYWLMLGGPDELALAWADALAIEWTESDSRVGA